VWPTADARKSPVRIRFKYNLFLRMDRTVGGRRQVHLGRPMKEARAGEHGYSVQTRDGSDCKADGTSAVGEGRYSADVLSVGSNDLCDARLLWGIFWISHSI